MPSVFLSHSSRDKALVRNLAEHIEQDQDLPDFQLALGWAVDHQASFTEWLASNGDQLMARIGSLNESFEIRHHRAQAAKERKEQDAEQCWLGNQALILKAWARLDEALDLVKQQEGFCRELGNKASLARCYWSWGLLARAQNDPQTEQQKLKAALALFTELKMPRQRDAVAAELDQADAAGAS